jgi:hypothetical protein
VTTRSKKFALSNDELPLLAQLPTQTLATQTEALDQRAVPVDVDV